jgi:hypothetical protein
VFPGDQRRPLAAVQRQLTHTRKPPAQKKRTTHGERARDGAASAAGAPALRAGGGGGGGAARARAASARRRSRARAEGGGGGARAAAATCETCRGGTLTKRSDRTPG